MQRAVLRQPFNGGDAGAIDLHGEARARLDGDAVEQHRARTALTVSQPTLVPVMPPKSRRK